MPQDFCEMQVQTLKKGDSPTQLSPVKDHVPLEMPEMDAKETLPTRPTTDEESLLSKSSKMTKHKVLKIASVFATVVVLILGRYNVPDNEVSCVQDKLMDAFAFANNFINAPGNEFFRSLFQGLCSAMVDVTFFITFGAWLLYSRNYRLPVTLLVFYIVRAAVQSVWFSPFPDGFYWESPGFPSLVVPYGRGSDFFFSGHAGFMIICTLEAGMRGWNKIRNFMIGATIYTCLILLVYRIHYSIDIFTGLIFAEWCFNKLRNYYKE